MNGDIGAFIPIVALSIPLAAVIGKQIVQPLIHSRALQGGGDESRVKMLEQRVATLEQSLETMERSVAQIADVADFHRQLATPVAEKAPGA